MLGIEQGAEIQKLWTQLLGVQHGFDLVVLTLPITGASESLVKVVFDLTKSTRAGGVAIRLPKLHDPDAERFLGYLGRYEGINAVRRMLWAWANSQAQIGTTICLSVTHGLREQRAWVSQTQTGRLDATGVIQCYYAAVEGICYPCLAKVPDFGTLVPDADPKKSWS
jgi:hypothetical protein